MKELIAAKEVIHRRVVPTVEAQAYFDRLGMKNKANLLGCRKSATSSIYTLCGYEDYFYGIMLPDTSYLTHFPFVFMPQESGFLPITDSIIRQSCFMCFRNLKHGEG